MKVRDIIAEIEKLAPPAYAEDFDNVGLIVGHEDTTVKGVLIAHDAIEEVIDEAVSSHCNLIISYHPIIFKGLKNLTGKTYVERAVIKAIRHQISIYAIHTALDNAYNGMNAVICNKLKLQNLQILIPQPYSIRKLTTYVPKEHADRLRQSLFDAGGGTIGNYDHCSFNVEGRGSFKGNPDANPQIGQIGKEEWVEETQLHLTYPKDKEAAVLNALFQNHPYEEVAYEIYKTENKNQHIGIGMYGELEQPLPEKDFLEMLKTTFHLKIIRHSRLREKPVKRVAVLGGSGAFAIAASKAVKADIFITGDLKYHDFFQAEDQIILADIGHYETEQFTKAFLYDYLTEKFPNFALVLSNTETNPIQYT